MGAKKKLVEDIYKESIEMATLDDMFWKVKVIMMDCAGSDQDRIYLNKFEEIAAKEKRFVIKNISKTQTLFMINQLGGEKKVKDDSLILFEECQAFVREKLKIPTYLMALTIKYLMLKMKDEYIFIQRQRFCVKDGLRRECATMIDNREVFRTVSETPQMTMDPEKKKKNTKGDVDPVAIISQEEKKYNTQLRVRGEEWRDKVYINDYPIDGPNLYIAITGFRDPHLCESLIKINVNVSAVIQIRIDPSVTKVPFDMLRPTNRRQSQTDFFMDESLIFWEELQKLRINFKSCDNLKNTAFILFSPPYFNNSKLSGEAEIIYDELCYLMYDIQDLGRQHLNYLEHLDVIEIPLEYLDLSCKLQYDEIIDELPLESVTIYSIIDSLLQVVTKKGNAEVIASSFSSTLNIKLSKTNKNIYKFEKSQHVVNKIFDVFNINENNNSYRSTFGKDFENYNGPIIIKYGNYYNNTAFHSSNIKLKSMVYKMLLESPVHKLWNKFAMPDEILKAKINHHINVLISCFENKDIKSCELISLLNVLACRRLYDNHNSKQNVTLTYKAELKKAFLKRSVLTETLPKTTRMLDILSSQSSLLPSMTNIDDQYAKSEVVFSVDCHDVFESVFAAANVNNPYHCITEYYNYYENHFGITSLQMIQNVFLKYNCVDYKYFEVTDSIILMFFNSHDSNGVSEQEWRYHLPTPVCLQDYFDFVLQEIYQWTTDQEKQYEEKMELIKQSECSQTVDIIASTSCVDNIEVGTDLLMKGSLKHQEYFDKIKSENASEINISRKKSTMPSAGTESLDKKRNKTPVSSTPKSGLKDNMLNDRLLNKDFIAFTLGDRRVEVLGKDAHFYSKDGSKVLVVYYMLIPANIEYLSLEISFGNENNIIKIHRALGDFVQHQDLDIDESFFITSNDGVLINILKQTYKVCVPKCYSSSVNNNESPSSIQNSSILDYETKFHHKVVITWPNGLLIESVHEEKSATITHIKQFYLKHLSNLHEDMRCTTRAGEVIVFKNNDNIEIFRPDGTYFIITKCEKKNLLSNTYDLTTPTTTTSTLSKQTSRQRDTKRSKSSKDRIDDSLQETKPREYELHIEDFEIIDTCGNREKYVNSVITDTDKLLIRTTMDYNLPEIHLRRMDGTDVVINKDGVQTITFHDNTRIISIICIDENETFPDWTDEEIIQFNILINETSEFKSTSSKRSYESCNQKRSNNYNEGYVCLSLTLIVEHPNFATVCINPDGKICIDSPNDISVSVHNKHIDMKLSESTKAAFDGKQLYMDYIACNQCRRNTTCQVNICKDSETGKTWWMKMKDSYDKQISVNEEGGLSVKEVKTHSPYNDGRDEYQKWSTNDSLTSCLTCQKRSKLDQQFFILRRDLTCSELIHQDSVKEYLRPYEQDPWCSVNRNAVCGDQTSVLVIHTPIYITESEKWIMNSKLSDLTHYKNCNKDEMKRFYNWMRPYSRFDAKPLKTNGARLPKAFTRRILGRQWNENKSGARAVEELVKAVLKCKNVIEIENVDIPNLPPPNDSGVRRFEELSHRATVGLKKRLDEEMLRHMKPDITTTTRTCSYRTMLPNETATQQLTVEDDTTDGNLFVEQKHRGKLCRLRAEETMDEHFYRHLIRQGDVPPYFRNILGGAIWCELMSAVDEAIDRKELKPAPTDESLKN